MNLSQLPSTVGEFYAAAPRWVFPAAEYGMLGLLVICIVHAANRGASGVIYILGGVCFGVLLEFMEVYLGHYTYGMFDIMLGNTQNAVPFCIGAGWGIIMYSARLFSDRLGMTLWAAAALDSLIALNIDLSMDVVAYRTHMWTWNWAVYAQNPITAQWFGIPFGNFVGWQTVVFGYSGFNRLYERFFLKQGSSVGSRILIVTISFICALILLFLSQLLYGVLKVHLQIASVHRFILFSLILVYMVFASWPSRVVTDTAHSAFVSWIVPAWFHVFFGFCFFFLEFHKENSWMTVAACINLVLAVGIHFLPVLAKRSSPKSGS